MSDIYYEDYSDRSIVVLGETKPHKDNLKSMGGRFNSRLRNGKVGWIFPKKSEDFIKDYIENGKVTVKVISKQSENNNVDLKKLEKKVDNLEKKLDVIIELLQNKVIGKTNKKLVNDDEEHYDDKPRFLRRINRPYNED